MEIINNNNNYEAVLLTKYYWGEMGGAFSTYRREEK
jgi:hypothetical protein